ncbi:GDP-mannose 4,6-dehydratase [Methanothrix sp.]|jgi:NAD dependent epimerase/dehydratase|uniref:NAD-dependent epimerase/dehydratase family protein n=1 Tax=Methanothrix soehngenii TaxID=2223 RepID=A0A7K4AHK8_METSH|nr:GDP-mannose 4,6-dehydratase [Methanothrix sp.]NLJ22405.1 NAD-dependent epimerase/dehydratase family protein [Methanothrix soehngenii]MBP7067709.1 GDP-mannose 4,6-dehydratase [Methanothrix sp.]UEC40819.1 MAG: UDP-glucose 4-epimerase [Methanothrix sp.]HOE44391.1 GDP-mannose 4,6-dehydratase [Methanothrix soehngenii]HOS21290.1 GDP-mannose 4,6-dehydratase [Methanothrix soehngenii]
MDNHWSRKKVLVTGAGGFIGSHLIERLIDLGADVKGFARYNSRNDWGLLEIIPSQKLDSLQIISGDLQDYDAVFSAVRDVDVIFHLGSLISIPYSYIRPRDTIENNILSTLNILTAARDLGVEKVVHTSSSEVYGTALYVPIDEKHPLQGQSPYSASKIGADKIAESFYCSFDLPVATIRPFNTYGPRQSARAIIPTIITQAIEQEKIKLGSLFPTRDYTFVKDTVNGFISTAESKSSIGEVINIGSNFEISMGDLAQRISSLLNKDIEITQDSSRVRPLKSEVKRLWCDNAKAKRLLGWEPQVSLDEGLKETIEWISENKKMIKLVKC